MGCGWSRQKRQLPKNFTFDGSYIATTPPTRGLSKRFWRNRHSCASSSGVSSGANTPIRGSKVYESRSSSSSESVPGIPKISFKLTPDSKQELIYKNLPAFLRNIPLDIELDDDLEKQFANLEELNESGGYCSDMSSSLPLRYTFTQRESSIMEVSIASDCEIDMDMEMLMMGKKFGIMQITSSPVMKRRNLNTTYDVSVKNDLSLPTPSASYEKWCKYLEMSPPYALQNITKLPEAIAGRFCPAKFPAYSEVLENELNHQQYHENIYEEIGETIIMELPVPTESTEL